MKLPERLSHLKHLIPTTCSEPKRNPSVFIYVIQCNDLIVTLRAALWRLNQSDYIKERGQRR